MTTRSNAEGIHEPSEEGLKPPWETVVEECPYRQMIVGAGGRYPFIAKRCGSWQCRRCARRRRLRNWWADHFRRAVTVYVAEEDLVATTWRGRREEATDEIEALLALDQRVGRLRNNMKSRLNARGASSVRVLAYRDEGQVTLTYWADRDLSHPAAWAFETWRAVTAEEALALFDERTAPGRPVDTKPSKSSEAGTEFRPSPLAEARIDGGGDWRHTREARGPDGALLSQHDSRILQRLKRSGWGTSPGTAVSGQAEGVEFVDLAAGRVAEELPPTARPKAFTQRVDTVVRLQGQPGVEYVEIADPASGDVVRRELVTRDGMPPVDAGQTLREEARRAWDELRNGPSRDAATRGAV